MKRIGDDVVNMLLRVFFNGFNFSSIFNYPITSDSHSLPVVLQNEPVLANQLARYLYRNRARCCAKKGLSAKY